MHMDVKARIIFGFCNASMLKCVSGFNPHGDRLKATNKACEKQNSHCVMEMKTVIMKYYAKKRKKSKKQ